MSDLVEFLEARITEDEAVAHAATDGPWTWDEEQAEDESFLYAPGNVAVIVGYGMHTQGFLECSDEDRTHIALHDPARVLAECQAKRAMLANIPKPTDVFDPLGGTSVYVLRCMAAVYSTHAEYRKEWAA